MSKYEKSEKYPVYIAVVTLFRTVLIAQSHQATGFILSEKLQGGATELCYISACVQQMGKFHPSVIFASTALRQVEQI
jgi:hypothetical protein